MSELRLLLMRHAKSSWKSDAVGDHDRPLNKRGRRDAPRIADRLAEVGWRPELVVSSDSTRTRQTWLLMQPRFSDTDVRFTPNLYLCDTVDLLGEVAALPSSVRTALLLGHNPGWEEAVEEMTGSAVTMTTANVALLRSAARGWVHAVKQPWQLVDLLRPKELG